MRRYELSDQQWTRIAPLLPHRTHHEQAGHPFNDPRPILNGILWILHTGAPCVIFRNATAPGRRFSRASTVGVRTAPGSASSPRCWTTWMTKAKSTMTCGVSTPPSSGPAERRLGRKKKGATRGSWADQNGRKCESHLTMRWGVREVALAQRSIWFATATGS